MSDDGSLDDLVARVKERVSDPARRVDERPSEFSAAISGAGVGELMTTARSAAIDLQDLLRRGPAEDLVVAAEGIRNRMETPAERPLPMPATSDEIAAGEDRLGVTLPPLLRRLYLEVAHGGFGPGPGLVGLRGGWTNDKGKSIEDLYAEMMEATTENPRWIWPRELVPIVEFGGVYACVDTAAPAGRIVEFDFEELDGRGRDGGWSRGFSDRAASFEAWLEEWLASTPPAERLAAAAEAAMSTVPEVTRAHWANMTAAQRAEYGLPETGWGRALFGDAWGGDPRDGSTDQ